MSAGVRRGALAIVAHAALWGATWLALEIFLAAGSEARADRGEVFARALGFAPWQALLFAGVGTAAALGARMRRTGSAALRPRTDPTGRDAWLWTATALAAIALACVPLGWGLLRHVSPPRAGLEVAAFAAAVVALLAVLALAGRALPARLAPAWPIAACAAFAVFAIPNLRNAAPALLLDPRLAVAQAAPLGPLAAAAAVLLAALAAGARSARPPVGAWLAAGAALLLLASAALPSPSPAPAPPARAPARSGLPDVVVVVVDTMRADLLGRTRDGVSLTPNLDAFAAEAIRFENAISPSNWTRSSMPALMTALSYEVTGGTLPEGALTFAERLRDAGYATFGLSANPTVSEALGYAQGFDRFVDPAAIPDFLVANLLRAAGAAAPAGTYHAGLVGSDLYYRGVSELRRRGQRALGTLDRPAFLYLHTMDVHGPYLPPRALLPRGYVRGDFLSYFDFLRLSGRGELVRRAPEVANLRDRYEAGMRLTDRELGAFFADLRARGRWDDTLVWVVSDHGEDFGEHDHAGHSGAGLWASLVHVPWLLKPPRSAALAPGTIPEAVSTRSLLPTTLGLLGLPPLDTSFAPDLTGRLRGGAPPAAPPVSAATDPGGIAYAATRLPFRRVRYFAKDGAERAALYRLDSDPAESADVSAAFGDVAAELDRAIAAQRELEGGFRFGGAAREIDPATRARLKALGYAE